MSAAPTTMIRPALEAAVQVARAGEAAEPSEPAPAALRRYLNFARLPAPALDIARKVVEEDAEFRARVASHITEADVGEAGWLWLSRPDGWEARIEDLRKKHQEREHAAHEEQVERQAHRRLAGAEDRARRAEVALMAKTQEVASVREELAAHRAARQQIETELNRVSATVNELGAQRNAAVRRLKEVEAELAQRTADLRHARAELRTRENDLAQTKATVMATPVASPVDGPATVEGPSADALDRASLAALVGEAARAAELLSGALAQAAHVLAPPEKSAPPPPPPAVASSGRTPVPARTPHPIPLGLAGDSAGAADVLLRIPGAQLLVDGYNISQAAWWGQPIAHQRSRLVDALAELHARTGIEIVVVFDGAEVEPAGLRAPRPAVHVRFSPPGVEADDVILDVLDSIPVRRPVIVASSDNRVRDGARRRGANVLGARQLLTALRR
jgi:predicted RNA-binding protein with PIN domain